MLSLLFLGAMKSVLKLSGLISFLWLIIFSDWRFLRSRLRTTKRSWSVLFCELLCVVVVYLEVLLPLLFLLALGEVGLKNDLFFFFIAVVCDCSYFYRILFMLFKLWSPPLILRLIPLAQIGPKTSIRMRLHLPSEHLVSMMSSCGQIFGTLTPSLSKIFILAK